MPELPEIESVKIILKSKIESCIINKVLIYNSQLRFPINKKVYLVNNNIILNVSRIARFIVLNLDNVNLLIHMGMSGYLRLFRNSQPLNKHDHFDLIIDEKYTLRYNDIRKFGYLLIVNHSRLKEIIYNLGVDPLSKNFNIEILKKLKNKKTAVKKIIMNNNIIVGIGNIYANEILFFSKILPNRPICSLEERELHVLFINIKNILKKSIQLGGSTIKNFILPNGKIGLFQKNFYVYNRQSKLCKICKSRIKKILINNRSTFFCEVCQK